MTVNAFNLLILIGAVHGITLSFLLLASRRNKRASNILLALLLTFYTLPVFKVILHDLGLFSNPRSWFWSIELLFGLGPALYLYAKTVTDQAYELSKADWAHFLPVVAEFAYYLGPWYREDVVHAFVAPVDGRHLIWMIEQAAAIASILVYLGLTNRLLWRYSQWVRSHFSDDHQRALRWLRRPVGLYSLFFALWLTLRAIDVSRFDDALPIAPYYPLLLFLSLSTYWIGTRGYLETQAPTTGFNHSKIPSITVSPDDGAKLASLFERLEQLMVQDALYRENDLRLTDLATRLNVNPRTLSRTINTQSKVSFYDYINGYRVAAVKRQLRSDTPRRTLLDLAHDCGFGSKATFNAVFKKSTGLTPSQYRKQLLRDDPSA